MERVDEAGECEYFYSIHASHQGARRCQRGAAPQILHPMSRYGHLSSRGVEGERRAYHVEAGAVSTTTVAKSQNTIGRGV